ncbi:MAG: insulinase family protein [Endomicrobium sp.]|jgi:zinc protease|nr:insulinase family protein [Endomicrobium sp.]
MKRIKILFMMTLCLAIMCGCVSKGVKRVKYDNGLTSILRSDKNSLAASVAVYVRTGAVNEKPHQAGLSHFLEHLMFKGSKNYPGDALSRRVENMGGYINAATSSEYTMYYVDVQRDGVEDAVKMLADTMQNPLFPEDEVNRERKVVIEEIQRYSDRPFAVLDETFTENIYEKSALRNSVIGTEKVISSVPRDEIFDYYAAHYVAQNMTVVISGNFDEDKISALVGETFGKFEKKPLPEEPLLFEEAHEGKEIAKKGKVEVGYLISGFLGPDASSDDIFAADLTMQVLGGGKSSRLYRVLKEEKQIVYSINSSFQTMRGTGCVYITAVFEPENYEEIKKEISVQIQNILDNGITVEELERAKLSMKTGWSFAFEKPSNIGYAYGIWNLMGRPEIVDEFLAKMAALKVSDAQEFLKKYYNKDCVINAALLPEDK